MAIAATIGVGIMGDVAGAEVGDFYCYNDGTVLERQCRKFDELGIWKTASGGSPARNTDLLAKALVLTIDARGIVLAGCGVIAGLSSGYLLRRSNEST
jgi:hypothetical protein